MGDGGVYMSEMAPGTTGYFQQYLKELQDKFKLKKLIFFLLISFIDSPTREAQSGKHCTW